MQRYMSAACWLGDNMQYKLFCQFLSHFRSHKALLCKRGDKRDDLKRPGSGENYSFKTSKNLNFISQKRMTF